MIVRPPLIEKSHPIIETLRIGLTGGTGLTQSPLSAHACNISGLLHDFRQGDVLRSQGHPSLPSPQAFHSPDSEVPSHRGVPRVLAGHEHTPRGCTNRRTGIALREDGPLLRHQIQAGRPNFFLPITTEVSIARGRQP